MSKDYSNSKGIAKLQEIVKTASLNNETDLITIRSKFNFHYFDKDNAGQDFNDWDKKELIKLLSSLKQYSCDSLSYWKKEKNLIIYNNFPVNAKTDFKEPNYIPLEAQWGRFRLGSKIRLVGFVIPKKEYHDVEHPKTKVRWDTNTFYIVFLDKEHKFWKTETD